jgi:hypothetical protein
MGTIKQHKMFQDADSRECVAKLVVLVKKKIKLKLLEV